mmetsp:Transcript_36942/g.81109  ORF Transcript_36942/g.81109 Transcript_36942/m.81109 type:complete len:85 (-) Transcript_36942:2264-2518(-)
MSNDAHMKVLHQLRRLPENRKCGSCRHEEKLGFKDVCVKFQIFVCGDCKSAHQAYSHRCKVQQCSRLVCVSSDALFFSHAYCGL